MQSFPEAFQKITANNRKGNFLNMIVDGRINNSIHLDHIFARRWKEIDLMHRFGLNKLEIRREAASPALFEFLVQDHMPFWNYVNTNGSTSPLPAFLITDTGKCLIILITFSRF